VTTLSICLAYWRNPGMLAHQYRVWADYPADLKARIEVLIVDDGSPEPARDVAKPDGLPALTLAEFPPTATPETPPWRQDAARNWAAHHATGDWLFLSDMDHVLPADSLRALLDRIWQPTGRDPVYSFHRLDAPNLTPKVDKQGRLHPHPNTYAMSKRTYWAVGGYDEDVLGIYGTDGYYRRKLIDHVTLVHWPDIPIVRFPREVIPDASTRTNRDAFRRNGFVQQVLADKQSKKLPPAVLTIPCDITYRGVGA